MAAPATVETIPATPTKVKQAGATEPATPMATTQPQMTEGRQGILARLRGRLGR
jgi:hypothetical protein